MVDAGFVTAEQAEAARRDMVSIAHAADKRPGHYFADWISDQLPGFVHFGDSDLVVVSTLDPPLQRAAEAQLAAMLDTESQRRKVRQAAVVMLGRDGAVRAMVGGRDYGQTQFNRAVAALRQPGSSLQAVHLPGGARSGMTASSTVLDAPIRIGGWSPENYEGRYMGEVTLADALAHSLNTATVRLIQHVGMHRRQRAGAPARHHDADPGQSVDRARHSEVSLLELTGAYARSRATASGSGPTASPRCATAPATCCGGAPGRARAGCSSPRSRGAPICC
ncbi:MAG: penicillin-binding transpeptidase domain-containing protein [Pseudomonadota bacterium]